MPASSFVSIISANDAAALSDTAHDTIISYINKKIHKACKKGLNSIVVNADVTPEIVHLLITQGYSVVYQRFDEDCGPFWIISWLSSSDE